MPRFKSINFYQNSPKIKLFLQKNAKFLSAGNSTSRSPSLRRLAALAPDPYPSAAWGLQNSPRPLRISGYATEFSKYGTRASERIFSRGTKIDTGPPKFGEEHKKKVLTQIWTHFLPKIREGAKKVFTQIWTHFLPKIR